MQHTLTRSTPLPLLSEHPVAQGTANLQIKLFKSCQFSQLTILSSPSVLACRHSAPPSYYFQLNGRFFTCSSSNHLAFSRFLVETRRGFLEKMKMCLILKEQASALLKMEGWRLILLSKSYILSVSRINSAKAPLHSVAPSCLSQQELSRMRNCREETSADWTSTPSLLPSVRFFVRCFNVVAHHHAY